MEHPIYQLFISSPGDVLAEQRLAEQVVMEFNRTWGRFFSIHLEALRYETHLYPQIGLDPQAAINETIGDDYDLYVGLIWKRFGTPTPRAGSGTEEEYERALARYQEQPGSIQIAFYFRNVSDADRFEAAEELERIETFRNRIGPTGTLWWSYRDPAEFETLFRIHLAFHVQRWLRGKPDLLRRVGAGKAAQPQPETEPAHGPDIGEVLSSMTEVLTRFGEDMNVHQGTLAQSTDLDELRSAFDGSMQALRDYASGLDRTLPQFAKAFAAAFRGPGRAAIHSLGASAGREKGEQVALTLIIMYLQMLRIQLEPIIESILVQVRVLFESTTTLREARAAPESQAVAADALRASSALLVEMIRADERLKQVSTMLEEIRGDVSK